MEGNTTPPGKIAFMFPAKFNLEGAKSPMLNFFVRDDGIVAMSMGISFLELTAGADYLVMMKLYNSKGVEIPISTSMGAIPGDQIDPIRRSSFLTASFHFKPTVDGTYSFSCELRDIIRKPEAPIATMEVLFSVLGTGANDGI